VLGVLPQLIWTDFEGVEKVYANIEAGSALTQGECRQEDNRNTRTEDAIPICRQ
jgi:hypothetical protein